MFESMKAEFIKSKLNSMAQVEKVGEILEVELKNRRVTAKILLKGENAPTPLSFNYAINGRTLCVSDVKTGKPWLDALADIFKDKYSNVNLNKYGIMVDIVKLLL